MACPNIEVCPYINSRDESEIIKYKNRFCNSDYCKCARFNVGNITGEVPDDLRPDDREAVTRFQVPSAKEADKQFPSDK